LLKPSRRRVRRGITLVELVVAMTLASVVLSTLAVISLRSQRLFREASAASGMAIQLREAAGILPIELRSLTPADGDIREARDTALEIRTTVASGIGCLASGSALQLAPATAGATSYASSVTPVDSGDTAWILAATDTDLNWWPHRIIGATDIAAHDSSCAARGPHIGTPPPGASAWRLQLDDSLAADRAVGTPVQITRRVRYSLYHAADGNWYLGLRDWNAAAGAYNSIQPVSGPFRPPSAQGAGGLVFTYLDTLGSILPSPVLAPRNIAAVQIDLRAESKIVARVLGSGPMPARMSDSVRLLAVVHNRG